MPISVTMMLADLTVLRLLCFAIAVLFLMLAIRAQFEVPVSGVVEAVKKVLARHH